MILCADIGGSFIDFGVVVDGRILHRHARPTPLHSFDDFVDTVAQLCAPWPAAPLHVGIAGIVDPLGGVVSAANIPCLRGESLVAALRKAAARTVLIANDADCFALAEAAFGAARGHRSVFGIILGTGVGGGYVLDGRIVPGLGGVSGEWGHGPFVIGPASAAAQIPAFRCGCGQVGCLDTIAGARGLERLHAWTGADAADSRRIVAGWEAGAPEMRRTMAIYLDYLSAALAVVVNVTGAMALPVGGGLSGSALLVNALDVAVRDRILARRTTPLVVPAVLGRDAGLLGAACLQGVHAVGRSM